jgi:hypothetical protein
MRIKWSIEQIQLIGELYEFCTAAEIADLLDCNASQIHNLAFRRGWKKSRAMIAAISLERSQTESHRGRLTRFAKGAKPWNVGISMPSRGRSGETQFKKGGEPKNTLPLGSYRTTKDGYLEQKVSSANGNASMRWKSVQRIIWEVHHGSIPKGHIVIYKEGKKSTILSEITIDSIECVSRKEHAIRNGAALRDAEIGGLLRIKAVITRQVNKIKKQHEKRVQT